MNEDIIILTQCSVLTEHVTTFSDIYSCNNVWFCKILSLNIVHGLWTHPSTYMHVQTHIHTTIIHCYGYFLLALIDNYYIPPLFSINIIWAISHWFPVTRPPPTWIFDQTHDFHKSELSHSMSKWTGVNTWHWQLCLKCKLCLL